MNRIFNALFPMGIIMASNWGYAQNPGDSSTALQIQPGGTGNSDTANYSDTLMSTNDSVIADETAVPNTIEDDEKEPSYGAGILDEDTNRHFQFILPLEGDVIHDPRLRVIIGLGKEVYSSVSFLLDGRPIPVAAVSRKNLLTIDIEDLSHGLHRLRVTFLDDSLKILAKKEVPFFVQLPEPIRTRQKGRFSRSGTVFLRSEYRNPMIINQVKGFKSFVAHDNTIKEGRLKEEFFPNSSHILHSSYRLKYKLLELQARLSLDSRENPYRQTSNRFGGRLNIGPWLSVKGGDVYPYMNDLVLRDTRIRGGEGKIAYVQKNVEWAGLEVAHGELVREIAPHVLVYKTGGSTRQDTIPGTYARNLTAARLGFGSRLQLFSLGIMMLRTEDKKHHWDDRIQDSIPHYAPEQNLAAGLDFQLGFWDHRIILFADAGYSLWTANTNAAVLGSDDSRFTVEYSGFTPEDYKDFFVINTSTRFHPDHPLKNLALQCGTRVGIPLRDLATETELYYYNTGDYYRSDGNPFLSTRGEKGIKLIQRLKLLENRLSLGAEGGYATRNLYTLDTASNNLGIFTFKGDVRYAPRDNLPSIWLGVNGVHSEPSKKSGLTSTNGFENKTLYMGGYHYILLGRGKLYSNISYSLTVNKNRLYASVLNAAADTAVSTKTHIFFSTAQYRRSNSPLIPFLRYSITSNGVRKSLNDVTMGSNLVFSRKLTGSGSIQVGEYPVRNDENDLKFGEQISIHYVSSKQHSIHMYEKVHRNGGETDFNIGASYELLF